jgi:hypothetical protein
MISIGFCPWCGRPIDALAIFARTHDMEWSNCKTMGCKGSKITIITDEHGFVIHPRHIRGRYIYADPSRKVTNE